MKQRLFQASVGLFNKIWYQRNHPLAWLLSPLSWIYNGIVCLRRQYLLRFVQKKTFGVPVVVVGNITVGGVGKTPLVIAIAEHLRARGIYVGVVSRGYGAQRKSFPHEVNVDKDTAKETGDEPLLIAKRTLCPVVISPNRTDAVQYMLNKYPLCQMIISDDGLQHYSLARQLEIVVIDGIRGLGNGKCLPAGPLREKKTRLANCDLLVVNEGSWEGAFDMQLLPHSIIQIASGKKINLSELPKVLAAVAGIGHPDRFFNTLNGLGLVFNQYSFPDHHDFKRADLNVKEKAVIMTEKDAIKCRSFAEETWYYLSVEANVSDAFWDAMDFHLQREVNNENR
ncbi:MAG: tetraacyldisaccharide 4'-kinase [Legionella sp.]|nr:tetraacyldisaccharide 4'-kinase [Legionella sp.]